MFPGHSHCLVDDQLKWQFFLLMYSWHDWQIWVEKKVHKLDVSAYVVGEERIRDVFRIIIHIYEWHSSQLVELWFHAGTNKSIERFGIIYLWLNRQQMYLKVKISLSEHNVVEEGGFCSEAINEQKRDRLN